MEAINWAGQHWLDLLQSVGIVAGLWFTAYTIRKDERARKITNLITIAQHHREIWGELYARPELSRILDRDADLVKRPISDEEHLFVNTVILHLDTVRRAMKEGMFVTLEGMRQDIRGFFSRPIPNAVWERTQGLQDSEFVRFIESCRHEN